MDLKNVASGAGIAQPPDVELHYGQSFVGGSLEPLDGATSILRLGLSGSCHDLNGGDKDMGSEIPAPT